MLFDADEAEIVAVEATEDGRVFALAAQGSKQVTAGRPPSHPAPQASVRVTASAPPQEENGGDSEANEGQPDAARRAAQTPRFTTPPGGTLYRIEPDGDFQKIWQAANEVPFGLVRLDDGTLLVATGDSGRIHAVREDGEASIRAQLPSDQASALSRAADGTVLVGGTTDARVARLGPTLRERGSYLSPVHDAGAMADWGRLVVDSERPAGSKLTVAVRAGNTSEPARSSRRSSRARGSRPGATGARLRGMRVRGSRPVWRRPAGRRHASSSSRRAPVHRVSAASSSSISRVTAGPRSPS